MVRANTAATDGAERLNAAVELQTSHVRDSVDTALAQGTELSEFALEVANDVAEPLKARTKVALDTLRKPIAV